MNKRINRLLFLPFLLMASASFLEISCSNGGKAPAPIYPVPQQKQIEWQKSEQLAFVHFGLNTFADKEWGYGDTPLSVFNPKKLDCDQWARTFREAGIKEVILTCKHHDGFCLWPTQLTDYCIRNTPYKNGKGDIVGDLSAACRRYGLKFGIYLSPWDRHSADYGTDKYVEYYCAELKELLTRYGKISEVWLDGANGGSGWYGGAREERRIDKRTYYHFDRIFAMVSKYQPDAVIFSDGGPGCRWVGNENGAAGETNWSFLRSGTVYPGYPKPEELQSGHEDGDEWVPAECDVSIRPGWFYHASEDNSVKSVAELADIYYKSIGRNANLIINVPPNKEGLISAQDSSILVNYNKKIREDLSHDLLHGINPRVSGSRGRNFDGSNANDGKYDTYWAVNDGVKDAEIEFDLPHPETLDRLLLQEYIPIGQRVKKFEVDYFSNGKWRKIDCGEQTTTIGYKRILRFDPVTAEKLKVRILDSRACPCINNIQAFFSGRTVEGNVSVERKSIEKRPSIPFKILQSGNKSVILDLGKEEEIGSFCYLPDKRLHGGNIITDYRISAVDKAGRTLKVLAQGEFSNIVNNPLPITVPFGKYKTRYLKFEALRIYSSQEGKEKSGSAAGTGEMKVFRALPVYKDISYSSAERTNDLLLRMTLDEKIGQLLCPTGWEMYEKKGDEVYCSEKYKQAVKKQNIGMLWAVFRADPWTKKTLKTGLDPKLAAETANKLQKYAIENSRLGIPVFIAEECPHGHMAIGTTVFPTGIALASSWSDSLLRAVGAVISREVRSQGAHIAFGPVIDLAREPRWSRVEETYGEDPCLSGRMAAAMVNGEGGGRLSGPYDAISTLKHFIAYGVPSGGQNGNASVVGLRELMQDYIPPFKMALDAGALSVMTAYSSIDGLPCTANKYLLDDVLRGQLKFRGMVISDLFSIEGLKDDHNVCPSYEDAAAAAMTAGVDVDLGVTAYEKLKKALALHLVEEKDIDSAAARVLRLKFAMGLFDYPYVDPKKTAGNVDSPANRKVALQAARESVVLLKNLRNILPLNKDVENVLVVGPNADNVYNMLGDYTAPQDPGRIVTVYDGIRKKLGEKHVMYVKGCSVRDTVNYNIDEAVRAASKADVVIAVVGGSSARDFKTEYKETGAAVSDAFSVSDMECGEGYDRATLCLLGRQMELLKKLKVAGKPLVVVYIEGRPLRMNWASENADALLTAWYPGEEGGSGIADVLFGDYNPSGRLPVSVPRSVGQLPVYYDQKMPLRHNYVEEDSSPLYPFGYGLSYTDFKYSGLKINSTSADSVVVSFCIRNIGKCTGWSVPQLYLRDECASVSQPVKELKGFEKVFLRKGEAKTVSFVLKPSDFSLININMKRVTEPGSFNIMIGESSSDIVLSGKLKR